MFDNILNWKLLSGSHEFPGPDGGTCINEAAIVAAGFPYRRIGSASGCPECFSRPIAGFAIALNDEMPDDLRQELLMPFVTRLAGTRDRPKVERERAKLIVFRTIRDVLPIMLYCAGLLPHAARCARSNNFNSAAHFVLDPRYAIEAIDHPLCESPMRSIVDAVVGLIDPHNKIALAVSQVSVAIAAVAERMEDYNRDAPRHVYKLATSILDDAIRLGKQADPIETALIVERMEAAGSKLAELELIVAVEDADGDIANVTLEQAL